MTRTAHGLAVVATLATGCATRVAAPRTAPLPEPAASYSLHLFDVGSGLSVLVRGEDFGLLYDAGSNDDRADGPGSRVAAYLVDVLGPSGPAGCGGSPKDAPFATLDHVFLSHPHRDHLSLFPAVFTCFRIANAWDSGFASETQGYRGFLDAVRSSGATFHRPTPLADLPTVPFAPGTRVALGKGARFTVLAVNPHAREENEASIVLRLELGTHSVLLMGDAEAGERAGADTPPAPSSVEGRLLARVPRELDVDVLVVGHHGSASSSRARFLERVTPTLALVSAGPMPYGKTRVRLPDRSVIDALRAVGATVLGTNVDDDACREAEIKVGADGDGSPGGCSAVTVRFLPERIDFDSRNLVEIR